MLSDKSMRSTKKGRFQIKRISPLWLKSGMRLLDCSSSRLKFIVEVVALFTAK